MNYEDYEKVLMSKYSREAWRELLHDIFGKRVEFYDSPVMVDANSEISQEAFYLGKITLADNRMIGIYEVKLADNVHVERNRVSIRNLLVQNWRGSGFAGAFMLCYCHGKSVLRFSYVSEVYRFDSDNHYSKSATDTKRYTYLLGEGKPCRTAVERFSDLRRSAQTLDDVTNAFSVEVLTKQFYNDLFEWYTWATEPEAGVYFPNNTSIADDDRENIETKIIRLITRVMFVWFIKQKDLVPAKLFDVSFLEQVLKDFDPQDATNGNYYNAILQNLFFATLNRAIVDENGEKRGFARLKGQRDIKTLYRYAELFCISENQVIDMFSSVPFLNGGLFECLDKTKTIDGVEVAYNYDGFSRSDKRFANGHYRWRAFIPNSLFFDPQKGLFSILNRYNFTIEENTPEDQQVALDPELLGKVFENLLGVYNPETRETARNQSGSFYTPREIVNYMVDESLIAFLGDAAVIRSLFAPDFEYREDEASVYKDITEKLKSVKILDPACGSGAFPMGMLHRIVDLMKKLRVSDNAYELKLHVIENCIYGVDNQNIAAQITKLRFFISLICDCEKDSSKPNYGIPTLPNLETKFVAADTLIKISRLKKGDITGNFFEDSQISETKKELQTVRHEHFRAKSASRKKALRSEDQSLRKKLADLLAADEGFAAEESKQLAAWNPYDQNAVSPFFDPEWMFGVADGFDIVIGNPPYIQLQNNSGALAKKYEGQGFCTFARKGDIYCLFYERGWQLLKDGGHLCYITSNKWMRAGYGEKTRGFFAKHTNPLLLIDFAGVKVFESATVDTNILLFGKEKNQGHTVCAVTNKENKNSVGNLSLFVQQQHTINSFMSSESWVILSPIEQSIKRKIESIGTPLKDWNIQINYGIKTGCNEAFIITTEKREEILSKCQTADERHRTEELIRPILRGRDIKRYGYNWAGLWLIATFPSRHYDIEKFPAVRDYLLSFGKERLEQAGKTYIVNGEKVKSRKKTNNKWFETQDSISYWEDFEKPQIVWIELSDEPKFSFAQNIMSVNTVFFLTGSNIQHLLGLLNSKLITWYFKHCIGTSSGVGTNRWLKYTIEQIPMVSPSELLTKLVKKMNNQNSSIVDCKIDEVVCELYKLTQEEANFIVK